MAQPAAATAPREEITLLEELPDPPAGPREKETELMLDLELNETPPNSVAPHTITEIPAPHTITEIPAPHNITEIPAPHTITEIPAPHTITEIPKLPAELQPSPPQSELPQITSDDAQRLAELFPRAVPLVSAPTIITTPTTLGPSHYLAMATPEVRTTPKTRGRGKRVSLARIWEEEKEEELAGGAEKELVIGAGEANKELGSGAGGAEKELGSGAGGAEELGSGAGGPEKELGSGAGGAEEELGSGAGGPEKELGSGAGGAEEELGSGAGEANKELAAASQCEEAETSPPVRESTGRGSSSMSLTCLVPQTPTESTPDPTDSIRASETVTDSVAMALTCVERESSRTTALADGATLTPVFSASVSHGDHVTSAELASTLPDSSPPCLQDDASESQMDITCQSEATPQTSRHSLESSPPSEESQLTVDRESDKPVNYTVTFPQPSVSETVEATPQTSSRHSLEPSPSDSREENQLTVDRESDKPVNHTVPLPQPSVSETVVPAEPSFHTSPLFKVPKRPLRSQLRLRSSVKKKVVAASPVVPTPLKPGPLSSLVQPSLNMTFTVSAPHSATPVEKPRLLNLASSVPITPLTSPPHTTPTTSPPHTSHTTSPPHTLPTTSPLHTSPTTSPPHTLPTMSPNSLPVEPAVESCSLLASPATSVSSPLSEAPTQPDWLQSPGDSFKLVHSVDNTLSGSHEFTPPTVCSGSDTLTGRGETAPPTVCSADTPTGPQETVLPPLVQEPEPEHDSQGNISLPVDQPRVAVGHTPGQTTQLALRLEQLQVSCPLTSKPLPLSIETPETALVVSDLPPPAAPSTNLHFSSPALPAGLDDTTVCGRRSLLLSASIYDKFVGQICSEEQERPLAATESGDSPEKCDYTTSDRASDEFEETLVEKGSQLVGPVTSNSYSHPLFSHFLSDLTSR